MRFAKLCRGEKPALTRLLAVLEHVPHQPGRVIHVRLGPVRFRRIDGLPPAHADKLVIDQVAVLRRHEIHVAAVGGRDDRLGEQHRLRRRVAESLGSVQGHVAVGPGEERISLARADPAVDQMHVRPRGDRTPQLLVLTHSVAREAALQQHHRPRTRIERPAEGRSVQRDDSLGEQCPGGRKVEFGSVRV